MTEHQIGIEKVPNVAGRLATGRVYVVLHDVDLEREFISDTLLAACNTAQVHWIVDGNGLASVAWSAALAPYHQTGKLKVLQRLQPTEIDLSSRLLEELSFIQPEAGSLILLESVDNLLTLSAESGLSIEADAWQSWAEKHQCTVLWLCPMRAGKQVLLPELTRLAHRFSGLSRLRRTEEGVRYDVFYWFSDEGLLTNKSYRVGLNAGHWQVLATDAPRLTGGEKPADEDDVFILRTVLPEGRSAPAGWRVFDSAETMLAALSASHACTVVFYYTVGSAIEPLAQQIFNLRHALGSMLKIAVKEDGGQMRKSNELLLLSVGVNLLIANGTGFTRLVDQLKLLQGRIYTQTLPSDFATVTANLKSVEELGYLAPANFIRVVKAGLQKSKQVKIPNVLIILPITEGIGVLETLRSCTMRRAGDLFTAAENTVYVFLSACEEQDVTVTLDRIFTLPVAVIFASESRLSTSDDILIALNDLTQQVSHNPPSDWSAELQQHALEAAKHAHTLDKTSTGHRVAPQRALTAVLSPLPLKTIQAEPEWELL